MLRAHIYVYLFAFVFHFKPSANISPFECVEIKLVHQLDENVKKLIHFLLIRNKFKPLFNTEEKKTKYNPTGAGGVTDPTNCDMKNVVYPNRFFCCRP